MSAGAERATRVNYDEIAGGYDERYESNPLPAVGEALVRLATGAGARRVLEVGCGTGHWLEALDRGEAPLQIVGLDPSAGMLDQAQQRPVALTLVQGRAEALPFAAGTLDLIYAVNAFHHFTDKARFLDGARRALRAGGARGRNGDVQHPNRLLYDYGDSSLRLSDSLRSALALAVKSHGLQNQSPIIRSLIPILPSHAQFA